eukprot:1438195-Pleurochrysis_carterae.AAC.1
MIPTTNGQKAGEGAGATRTYGAALGRGRGARGRLWPCASEESRVGGAERERSASTHAMRMQVWGSVHVSVKLRQMATVSGIEPHERAQ